MLKRHITDVLRSEYHYKENLLRMMRHALMQNVTVPDKEQILKIEDRLKCIRKEINVTYLMSDSEVKTCIIDIIESEKE